MSGPRGGLRWVRRDGHILVVLPRGSEVLEGIVEAAREAEVASAALSGVGAIEHPRLAWFDREARVYRDRVFEGVWEIAHLTGNLARLDGELRIHAHATIAGADLAARAGHLLGGTVGVTCEVVLVVWEEPILRRVDPAYDLPLIDPGAG